jgi:beta-mannosidase
MAEDSGGLGTAAAISFPGFDASGWYTALVPGTVLGTLVSQGVYPDPLYGNTIAAIPDLAGENRHYWFRTEFDLGLEDQGQRVWLTLHGINYRADVWVNGEPVGAMVGAFRRGVFDITAQAVSPGANALAVCIHPNDFPGTVHHRTSTTSIPNGGDILQDGPTFACTVGWDWIPTIPDRGMGIWREVTVQTTGPVVLQDLFVTTDLPLPNTTRAAVTLSVDVVNATAEPQTGSLCGRIGAVEFQQVLTLAAAETRRVTLSPESCPQLRLRNPRLWWPNGYGNPELYTLDLRFTAEDGEVSDTATTRFGVREFSYDFAPELVISVNGHRIFCRGGNWGFAEALSRNSRERYRNLIRFHRDANLNMIRNWIGMTDCPEFYDLCDENGIMVWDEFWLAYPGDGPEPADEPLFLDNAADKIRRNRNHPSIALWCARNEGMPPAGLDAGLRQLVSALDGTRRYQVASNTDGVHGGGPWGYRPPESYLTRWTRGWAYGFTTEIGLPCVPSADSMRQMMPAADLWPIREMWAWHDYAPGNGYPSDYTRAVNTRYGTATGLDDFCRKAQLLNLESHRAIFESWNQRMWNPDAGTSGVLLWATNPCWPSTVWQLYDYYLEPTAAYFGVKAACEPVHVQMSLVDGTVSVVNTTLHDLSGLVVTARAFHLDGAEELAASTSCAGLSVPANSALPCFQLALPYAFSQAYFVKLVARDRGGQLVSENFYWRSAADPDFTSLSRLPVVEFGVQTDVTIVPSAAGAVGRVSMVLTNATAGVVVAARLKLTGDQTGRRVLPVFWSDNYISFLPGETRTVTAEFDPALLAGDLPVLTTEGSNVTPRSRGLIWPDPPAAVVMDENSTPRPFSLTLRATDADNGTLTWSIATQASHGTATAAGTGTSMAIGYTPTANWSGADTFVVQVSNELGDRATIAVSVTVVGTGDVPADCYVDDDGDDANPGTSSTAPMQHLQALLDRYPGIGAGCTVHLAPGVYRENVHLGGRHGGLVIEGAGDGANPAAATHLIGQGGAANLDVLLVTAGGPDAAHPTVIRGLRVSSPGGLGRDRNPDAPTYGGITLDATPAKGGRGGGGRLQYVRLIAVTATAVTGQGTGCGVLITGSSPADRVSDVTLDGCTAAGNSYAGILLVDTQTANLTLGGSLPSAIWQNGGPGLVLVGEPVNRSAPFAPFAIANTSFYGNHGYDIELRYANTDIDATAGCVFVGAATVAEIEPRLWHRPDGPALGLVSFGAPVLGGNRLCWDPVTLRFRLNGADLSVGDAWYALGVPIGAHARIQVVARANALSAVVRAVDLNGGDHTDAVPVLDRNQLYFKWTLRGTRLARLDETSQAGPPAVFASYDSRRNTTLVGWASSPGLWLYSHLILAPEDLRRDYARP